MQLRNFIIGILLMLLAVGFVDRCTQAKTYENLIQAKDSNLVKFRNKATGAETASRQVMVAQKKEILALRAGAYEDSLTITQLQEAIRRQPKGTRSATVVSRTIAAKASGATIVFSADTARAKVSSSDGLTTGSVTITKDSAKVELDIKDRLAFYQVDEKPNIFAATVPTVYVNNLHPNVTITGLRSYQVKQKGLKKVGRGWIFLGGVLVGTGTYIYLQR